MWEIKDEVDFTSKVRLGITTESLHLDFKAALDRGLGAQAELGRDVAQFANNDGGCLLIGVTERTDPTTGIKTAATVVGVADPNQCRADVEAWIRNVLVPADFSRTVDFIRTPTATVVAVNVPASRRLIWVNDPGQPNKLEVVRRTNHGKEYMRPNEIERQWSNSLRSAQIAFQHAVDEATRMRPQLTAREIEIVGGVLRVNRLNAIHDLVRPTGRPSLETHDPYGFSVRITIGTTPYSVRVPFELLSTAWIAPDGVIHVLFLAPLVHNVNEDILQFDPFGFVRSR